MYDLETFEKTFEFEIYEGFDYLVQSEYFHAFEMEDFMAGLSFPAGCEKEAEMCVLDLNSLK